MLLLSDCGVAQLAELSGDKYRHLRCLRLEMATSTTPLLATATSLKCAFERLSMLEELYLEIASPDDSDDEDYAEDDYLSRGLGDISWLLPCVRSFELEHCLPEFPRIVAPQMRNCKLNVGFQCETYCVDLLSSAPDLRSIFCNCKAFDVDGPLEGVGANVCVYYVCLSCIAVLCDVMCVCLPDYCCAVCLCGCVPDS